MDQNELTNHDQSKRLAKKIIIGMALGIIIGLLLNFIPKYEVINVYLIDGLLSFIGKIFIDLLMMLVVPIVLVSLVCGSSHISNTRKLGSLAGKTLLLYILTTAVAICIALVVAYITNIGSGSNLQLPTGFESMDVPMLKDMLFNLIPKNPVEALAKGNILQIIIFALIFGYAIAQSGKPGQRIKAFFDDLNEIIMKLIMLIMVLAPYGVFCLVATLFAKIGFELILNLISYFVVVTLVLMIQLFVTYPVMLKLFANISPIQFFKKMYSAIIFAFSVSSSNASIPIVLKTVRDKLGVDNTVASFIIPLGATINMDGTAIMQGVATVFIANTYGIDIGLTGYLTVIFTAVLASIGTAGVPSVGLITLTLVLKQVGLPIEGIAMIIGIDRLLDMIRTSVNISGDATVACIVGKSEKAFDEEIFLEN